VIKHTVIAEHAATHPAAPAILTSDRNLSWSELADATARLTTGLAKLVPSQAGSAGPVRAAFLSENRWEVIVLQAAAATLGLPLVGIDYSLPPAHVAACLRQLQPEAIFVSPARTRLLAQALRMGGPGGVLGRTPAMVLLPGEDRDSLSGALAWHWDELTGMAPDPAAWQALPFEGLGFTSGTTSAPKLVLRSRPFDAQRQRDVIRFFGITPGEAYLNTVPLYHASGPGWAKVFMALGGPVALAPYDDPAAMLAALHAHRVTGTLMVPPVLESLTRHVAGGAGASGLALRFVVTGGRHVSRSLVRRATAALGDVLHVYYGTTETGLNTLTAPGEVSASPGVAGSPFPGNQIVILGEDGKPVPPCGHGRVAVVSYMLADSYAALAAPTADIDGETAWLTPDTGWLDHDGRLHVMARDLPAEAGQLDVVRLEGELGDVLGVSDVAVCAESRDGELQLTVGYVPGAEAGPSEADVAAEVTRRTGVLAVHACQVAQIPYSPTGKVRFSALLSTAGRSLTVAGA
jgi:acyl-coenzyme A synthetase/AMP-(fatty) acid ligase